MFLRSYAEELCDPSSFWDILIKAHKQDHCKLQIFMTDCLSDS